MEKGERTEGREDETHDGVLFAVLPSGLVIRSMESIGHEFQFFRDAPGIFEFNRFAIHLGELAARDVHTIRFEGLRASTKVGQNQCNLSG